MALPRLRRLLGVLLVVGALTLSLQLYRRLRLTSATSLDSGCTLVINVFSRPGTIPETLQHYASSTSLKHIVVLWAGPTAVNRAELQEAAGTMPLSVIVPPSPSLNWRFYPWSEIRTDCVISMDDDWRMPHDHLDRVSEVWHAGYQDSWVGFEHMGRNHVSRDVADGRTKQPVYAPTFWSQYAAKPKQMPPSKFHSIMLPSGAALSRRYFEAYHTAPWAAARAVVDELTNCEDLLMNYVVTNMTSARIGPAFVQAWAKPFQVDGLWFRPKHLGTRSECLQRFENLTGGHLVYSDAYIPLAGDIPQHSTFSHSSTIPFDLPCDRPLYERDGICEIADHDAGWASIGEPWISRYLTDGRSSVITTRNAGGLPGNVVALA